MFGEFLEARDGTGARGVGGDQRDGPSGEARMRRELGGDGAFARPVRSHQHEALGAHKIDRQRFQPRIERRGQRQRHVGEAGLGAFLGQHMREGIRQAMAREGREQLAAMEFAALDLRRFLAQAPDQRLVITGFEIGFGRLFFFRRRRLDGGAHHDAVLGALAGDDDGLAAHFGAHAGERGFHILGDEGAQLHGVRPVPRFSSGWKRGFRFATSPPSGRGSVRRWSARRA